jgi:hypothetical protein
MNLFHNCDFQISAPQSPTQYTPQRNNDVLDIVVHRNVLPSDVTVSDVLDSDHLPIFLHILDHVSAGDISAPGETHTNWERLRSLNSELISPRIHIHTIEEGEKAASTFTASIASAYRLSIRKLTLPVELPGLDHLLQLKQRLWSSSFTYP